jgi:hypothetical protein
LICWSSKRATRKARTSWLANLTIEIKEEIDDEIKEMRR